MTTPIWDFWQDAGEPTVFADGSAPDAADEHANAMRGGGDDDHDGSHSEDSSYSSEENLLKLQDLLSCSSSSCSSDDDVVSDRIDALALSASAAAAPSHDDLKAQKRAEIAM